MEMCTQCGLDASEFQEGVCVDCCRENQLSLDQHNIQHDRWQRMSDEDRAAAVTNAIKNYTTII